MSFTQDINLGDSPFATVRPDLIMVVTGHPTGANIIDIQMVDATYPPELLRSQIQKMCTLLGSDARGLDVRTETVPGVQGGVVHAHFGTNGLVVNSGEAIRLQAILKAFAGAPAPHTVKGLDIGFDGMSPTHSTVQIYNRPGIVKSEARFITQPAAIEYRIELLTQDPDKISYPDSLEGNREAPVVPQPAPVRQNRTLVVVLIIVAGLALAALVYLALLRGGQRARP
jgi:hypothetical protein